MRRSSSRMFVAYSSSARRSVAPSSRFRSANSVATQSSTLCFVRSRSDRCFAESPAPNSASNTARGSRIPGSGVLGAAHETDVLYAQW